MSSDRRGFHPPCHGELMQLIDKVLLAAALPMAAYSLYLVGGLIA